MPAGLKPGWVVIEFENPACDPLPRQSFGRTILVPASGRRKPLEWGKGIQWPGKPKVEPLVSPAP